MDFAMDSSSKGNYETFVQEMKINYKQSNTPNRSQRAGK